MSASWVVMIPAGFSARRVVRLGNEKNIIWTMANFKTTDAELVEEFRLAGAIIKEHKP